MSKTQLSDFIQGSKTATLDTLTVTSQADFSGAIVTGLSGGSGSGDVVGPAASVDSELPLFSGTGGKTLKRASATGLVKLTSGVASTATAGTDYVVPAGLTKAAVGLGNVDNTADSAKPVSTATQAALDLKAPLDSPNLTGTPSIPSFASATHSHANAAGGGTLGAAAIGSGTVATARLGAGTADGTTFLRGDQTWATPSGSGDVVGPSSSVDSEIALFNSTTGKAIKRASISGIAKLASGVLSAATPGTDFETAGTGATHAALTSAHGATGAVVGTTNAQTLSAKTINGANNTLTVRLANDVSGTLPVGNLPIASTANVRTGTADKLLTSDNVEAALAFVALTDGSSIALDLDSGINFSVTLAGNRTLANPTNGVPGKVYVVQATQDGTGSRTLAFGNQYVFPGGVAPVLTTSAAAKDILCIQSLTSTLFLVTALLDVK